MTAAREDRRRLAPSRGKRSRQRWWLSYGVLIHDFGLTVVRRSLKLCRCRRFLLGSRRASCRVGTVRMLEAGSFHTASLSSRKGMVVPKGRVEKWKNGKMEISKHCQDPESGTTMFLSVRILSISYTIAVPKVPSVVVDFGWHPRGVQEKRGVQETTTINAFGRTSQPPPSNSGTAHFFCRDELIRLPASP